MAIMEYLEELQPTPRCYPPRPGLRQVRALAQMVACEIHLLNNPACSSTFTGNPLHADEDAKMPGTTTARQA